MKLTPMEISNKEFKKVLRGYSTEEVDEFLDRVVEEYEALFKENSQLKDKLDSTVEKLNHYTQIENTIQNTLILAQDTAEQSKRSAQEEADRIIRKANDTAQKILDKAHNDVLQINDDYDRTKQEFSKFRAKFRNFMSFQMETFDDLEKDFVKNFNISKPTENFDEKGIEVEEMEPVREQSVNYNQSYNNTYDERSYGSSYINDEEDEEDLGLTTQINFNSNEIEFGNDDIEATQKININEINDELLLDDDMKEIKSYFAKN